jgi:hypothetical protein
MRLLLAVLLVASCSSSNGLVGPELLPYDPDGLDLDNLPLDPVPRPVMTPIPELLPYDPDGLESGCELASTRSTIPLGKMVYIPVFRKP